MFFSQDFKRILSAIADKGFLTVPKCIINVQGKQLVTKVNNQGFFIIIYPCTYLSIKYQTSSRAFLN